MAFALVYGTVFSASSLVLEELGYHRYTRWQDLLWMSLFGLWENLGYHQLIIVWRLEGLIDFLRREQW